MLSKTFNRSFENGRQSLVNAVKKTAGPQSVDELIRKGPPTRDEIEAIMEKGALGLVATDEEQAILQSIILEFAEQTISQ